MSNVAIFCAYNNLEEIQGISDLPGQLLEGRTKLLGTGQVAPAW